MVLSLSSEISFLYSYGLCTTLWVILLKMDRKTRAKKSEGRYILDLEFNLCLFFSRLMYHVQTSRLFSGFVTSSPHLDQIRMDTVVGELRILESKDGETLIGST